LRNCLNRIIAELLELRKRRIAELFEEIGLVLKKKMY